MKWYIDKNDYRKTTNWFAWFPVVARSGSKEYTVWLEKVIRKPIMRAGDKCWTYRVINRGEQS